MVFDDDFSTVIFMREVTIPPNWTDIGKSSSQRYSQKDIDLKDTWFNTYLEENPREYPSHEPIVTPYDANNTLTLSQYIPHIQEIPAREG